MIRKEEDGGGHPPTDTNDNKPTFGLELFEPLRLNDVVRADISSLERMGDDGRWPPITPAAGDIPEKMLKEGEGIGGLAAAI